MKGLEALEHIVKDDFDMIITTDPPKKAFGGITEGDMVEIIEKELKALEIIKKKEVKIEWYCGGVFLTPCLPLTDEEYDLLKEVLEHDTY